MLRLIPSTLDMVEVEKTIMNSNPFFNLISKDKEELSPEEIEKEMFESQKIGAERYIIQEGDHSIGILEYLMNNPSDGYPWLGLLVIKKEHQSQGYGVQALQEFYNIMTERQVKAFRIGVIVGNEPAHRFWRKQGFMEVTKKRGFMEVTKKRWMDHKEVIVYEKSI